MRAERSVTRRGARAASDTDRSSPPSAWPAPICSKSAAARAIPAGGASMSAPRSKRIDASVFSPSRLLVRRTDGRLEVRALERDARRRRADFGVARRP